MYRIFRSLKTKKIIIIVALITVVGVVFALKQQSKNTVSDSVVSSSAPNSMTDDKTQNLENPKSTETTVKLPRLVDLGADKCIPCKMMKPILDELKQDYKDQFQVTFIDVWESPSAGEKYGIRLIPTQIFFDAGGNELFRHEGFFSKEDILAKWKEFGIDLGN